MSNLKAAETLFCKTDELLTRKKEDLQKIREQLDQDAAAIAEADQKMEEATRAADFTAFQAAKKARQDAEDAKEMHSRARDMMKEGGIISKEEAEADIKAVFAEFDKAEADAMKKILDLAEKMGAIADDLAAAERHANAVLMKYQQGLFPGIERPRTIDKWDVYNLGRAGVTHYYYKDAKAKQGKR